MTEGEEANFLHGIQVSHIVDMAVRSFSASRSATQLLKNGTIVMWKSRKSHMTVSRLLRHDAASTHPPPIFGRTSCSPFRMRTLLAIIIRASGIENGTRT